MIDLYSLLRRKIPASSVKPVVLLVLDGWGVAPSSHGNAIAQANTPHIKSLLENYPHGELIASGESVGLPANEVGNTEVGHLTMGAGTVVLQDLKRINMAIYTRTFFENLSFLKAIDHIKTHGSRLHIMGLASSGNVHSSLEHLYALIQFCKLQNLTNVGFHLFTDGRDSPPKEAASLYEEIENRIVQLGVGRIATIAGRYYAMDRDSRWDRTKLAYEAIVEGKGIVVNSAAEVIKHAYTNNLTDEFIQPSVIVSDGKPITVEDNDAVIFYNFRVDRPRQLTMAFTLAAFETLRSFEYGYASDREKAVGKVQFNQTFVRNKKPQNLFFVTMTEYQKAFPVNAIAFPPEVVSKPLGHILSEAGLMQMHMSESEKERFVTYYFNGLREQKFPGEDVVIVPSPKVATYDKKPEMSVFKLEKAFEDALRHGKYHFFVINFANPDMVAHTGNIKATIKALEATDKAIGRVVQSIFEVQGTLLITADHGNAEELITFPSQSFFFTTDRGSTNTDHSNNPVPFIVVRQEYFGKKIALPRGSLSDIAPTILGIMKLPKPAEMAGKNLLEGITLP